MTGLHWRSRYTCASILSFQDNADGAGAGAGVDDASVGADDDPGADDIAGPGADDCVGASADDGAARLACTVTPALG